MCFKLNQNLEKSCSCKFAHLCKRRKEFEVVEIQRDRLPLVYAVATPLSSKYFDLKLKLHAEKGTHF